MTSLKRILYGLKPGVPKRWLLLVAAGVWTLAGSILLWKGIDHFVHFPDHLLMRFFAAAVAGTVIFRILFMRISLKHINRIRSIDILRPCIFSFFNFRSYILMGTMIAMGITLRHLSFIDKELLYNFYIAMGIPLLVSAVRFCFAWLTYPKVISQ